MNEVFRPPRKSLYEALACSVLFAGVAASWLAVWLVSEPPQPPPSWVVCFFCAVEVFFLGFFAWSLHGVAAYWRQELHVDGAEVRFRGVFRSAALDLSTVTQAKWRRGPGGSVKLCADGQRLTIPLYREARLMEYLHQQIPWAAQVDWPRFYLDFLRPRVIGPDHILVDRKRIDRYLLSAALLCVAVLLICGIWVGLQKAVTGACLAALFLLGLRFLVPKKGFHDKSMQAKFREDPETKWFLSLQLLLLALMATYSVLACRLRLELPDWIDASCMTIGVVGMIVTLVWAARLDRIGARKRKAEAEAAWTAEHDPIQK